MATSTIAINITGNTADITRKIKQVNANLSGMGRRAGKAKARMAGLGRSFGGVMGKASALSAGFLGIAAAMRVVSGTLKTLANFGFEMSKVQAISGATGEQFEQMTALARKMGATTMFTATQAAEGMKFLSMAGFSAKESMAALPAVLDLAQAGTIDLARAADIASNIMAAFGVNTDKMGDVADDMVTIVNSANTNVQQLGDAMKYVGAAAAASGISIPTVSAAIGVLSNAGMQGAMAGTGLRQVFIRLTNVTRASEDALRGMGLTMDMVNPQKVGLTEALHRLSEAGMTGSEAIRIFGARGAIAALNLAAGLDKYHSLKDAMDDNAGAAKNVTKIMQNNLMGAFKLFKSAIQDAVIGMGSKGLTGGLQNSIGVITEWIRILGGTGDPASKFYESGMKMKLVMERVITAVKVFFLLWAAQKVTFIVHALGIAVWKMGVLVVKAFAAMRAATISLSVSMRALAVAIAMTGIGALVVGLGWLIGKLMGTGDAAKIAASRVEALLKKTQEWSKKMLTFRLAEGEEGAGGTDKSGIDMADLKDVDDITSLEDLASQSSIAKKLHTANKNLAEPYVKARERYQNRRDKKGKSATPVHKDDMRNAMDLAGVEGEANYENFSKAVDMLQDKTKRALIMVNGLQQESIRQGIKLNIARKQYNVELQESLQFMKEMGELAKRGVTADDSQAGVVEALKAKIKSTAAAIGAAAAVGDDDKQERLEGQWRALEKQLNLEQDLLHAKRSGSSALEKQVELEKKLLSVVEERERHAKRAKEQTIDEAVFGRGQGGSEGTTPLDLVNQLDSFEQDATKIAKELAAITTENGVTGEVLIGSNAFDLHGMMARTQKDIKEFGAGGKFEDNFSDIGSAGAKDAWIKLEKLRLAAVNERKTLDATGGGTESRPAGPAEKELMKAFSSQMSQIGGLEEGGSKSLFKKTTVQMLATLKRELKNASPKMKALWDDAKEPLEGGGFTIKLDALRTLFDFIEKNNKNISDQGMQIAGKEKAIRDNALRQMKAGALERAKELQAQRKVLDVDNRSVDMQKRKLKLLGEKTGGKDSRQALAEMEGKEQLADHMFKYEQDLRKQQEMEKEEDWKGDRLTPEGGLTDDKIGRLLEEEGDIAAAVIAGELAAQGKGKGAFGVSSLAKIGGGGGVGAGGETPLDAIKFGNVLKEKANQLLKRIGDGIDKWIPSDYDEPAPLGDVTRTS